MKGWFQITGCLCPAGKSAALAALLLLVLVGCGGSGQKQLVSLTRQSASGQESADAQERTEALLQETGTLPEAGTSCAQTVIVYVCGAVVQPGVYELVAPARLYEAVQAAGGLREDARAEQVNLAQPISDGEQLYIPCEADGTAQVLGDSAQTDAVLGDGAQAGAVSGKVNINTAGKEELMTLSGIGEVKAEAILAYRAANGAFTSIEEIMRVPGIKQASFEKIRDAIIV